MKREYPHARSRMLEEALRRVKAESRDWVTEIMDWENEVLKLIRGMEVVVKRHTALEARVARVERENAPLPWDMKMLKRLEALEMQVTTMNLRIKGLEGE